MIGGDTVLLVAMRTGSNDWHDEPLFTEYLIYRMHYRDAFLQEVEPGGATGLPDPRSTMLSYGTMPENFKELFARGYKARREDRLADSRAIFIKAVRNAAEEGDRPSLAEALCGLGQAERGIGNLEAARHHYAEAAILYRQIGPPARLAYAIRHEADILREACLPAEAEPLYLEAEAIYRQQGEEAELDLANTLRGLALVNESSGRSDAARLLFQQARELYAKCKVEAGVAGV
jgi:tetratricopeptide (TPR) repeat protein